MCSVSSLLIKFMRKILEEGKKLLTTERKTVLDTLVRKLKFIYSGELGRGSNILFSIMLTTVPFRIGEMWCDNIIIF